MMCTLILGLDTVGRGSVIMAANRDEDPARPSAPPGVLSERPRVAGGRDLMKGGTWLAIRGRRAAVAMLNRRDETDASAPARRSRGLLALDVAAAADGSPDAALAFAREAAAAGPFAPFSLIFAAPGGCWLLSNQRGALRATRIAPGWHAITHADLDDRSEPRTRWLMSRLAAFTPPSPTEAERGLLDMLRSHGVTGAPGSVATAGATGPTPRGPGPAPGPSSRGSEPPPADPAAAPPVCLHSGPMQTVSAAIVRLAEDDVRYLHLEGRPCTAEPLDCTHLLDAGLPARRP